MKIPLEVQVLQFFIVYSVYVFVYFIHYFSLTICLQPPAVALVRFLDSFSALPLPLHSFHPEMSMPYFYLSFSVPSSSFFFCFNIQKFSLLFPSYFCSSYSFCVFIWNGPDSDIAVFLNRSMCFLLPGSSPLLPP